MVDFKVMKAISDGSVIVPGNWILGARPRKWCDMYPNFYMKYAPHIKEFYTVLPPYVRDYTEFNCGHMACHYLASKHQPDVINMYGFDSIFDFDLRSCTDFYLVSVRDEENTARLTNNWRRIWPEIFNEFSNIKFRLHSRHPSIKIQLPKNAEVVIGSDR